MLIVGDCFGIRSEHQLCDKVHLNLAYRSGEFLGWMMDNKKIARHVYENPLNGSTKVSTISSKTFDSSHLSY